MKRLFEAGYGLFRPKEEAPETLFFTDNGGYAARAIDKAAESLCSTGEVIVHEYQLVNSYKVRRPVIAEKLKG